MAFDASEQQPDFSTLSGIMKRFRETPFAQFHQELDRYFKDQFDSSLSAASPEQREQLILFRNKIMDFADDIMGQSELLNECQQILRGTGKADQP